MDSTESKIKFYSLGSEKLDLSKLVNNEIDLSKPVKPSKEFNEALSIVTKKDINALNKKVRSIQKEITNRLVSNDYKFDGTLEFEIKDIDKLLNRVEEILNNLISTKNKNKVRLFSTNKKNKKSNLKKIEDSIEYLLKCKKELISMKNEYNKLMTRSIFSESILINDNKKDTQIEKEDPIERTINFYMNNLK